MSIPTGLQIYTILDEARRDLVGTIRRVAAIGYDGVEFAGYFDIPAATLQRALAESGLRAAGTHVGLPLLHTDPDLVSFELDTYRVEKAGVDALRLFQQHAQRCTFIHFKDAIDRLHWRDTEIGVGIIDVAGILAAVPQSTVRWFIVEQEAFDMPLLESVAVSLANLRRMSASPGKGRRMSSELKFRRETIWRGAPGERTLCVVGDVTGNGTPEIIIASRRPLPELYYLHRDSGGSWQRVDMNFDCGRLEAGGCLADINRNGRLDFVAGSDAGGDRIFWFENPGEVGAPWPLHEIVRMPANQSHDQLVADLDGDSRLELIAGQSWFRPPTDPAGPARLSQ